MSTQEEWEAQGPYTCGRLLYWIFQRPEHWDAVPLLNRVLPLFPRDELEKVLDIQKNFGQAEHEKFLARSYEWNAVPIDSKFNDEQLEVLARHGMICAPLDLSEMILDFPQEKRLSLFKMMRDHYRDKSPKRK